VGFIGNTLEIDSSDINIDNIERGLIKKIRASILLL
jgi:hypothetical protein